MARSTGISVERELEKVLTAEGYAVVRSAGSHGPADLYVLDDSGLRMIQLKSTYSFEAKHNISVFCDAIEYLLTLPSPPNSTKELWVKVTRRGFRYIVVDDAPSDRKELLQYVKEAKWTKFEKGKRCITPPKQMNFGA